MASETLVLGTVITAVGTTELNRVITKKGFDLDPVLGGFILGIFLYAITEASPVIGTRFCILIIVTAILINGLVIFPVIAPNGKLYKKG